MLSEWPKVSQLVNGDQGLQLGAMFSQHQERSLSADDLPQAEPCFSASKKKKKTSSAKG